MQPYLPCCDLQPLSRVTGADSGEVKRVNFHPPFFLSPLLSFFSLIPQRLIGSITLLQKFTPRFKILDPRLGYNSSEERIISFERTKTKHDKLPGENNSLITTRQITLHIICINFQVVFFENNLLEFASLNGVCEEIIKPHIFIESRQANF